ncbi:VWA domain-containing protein [Saccharomonospora sp. CUA-673]|uniref:VWA domain-containing protein n=1 Tax=Saccharomonospora sp. CUA-673 TaxID=1904969 RepID=UPI000960A904|nr:VWA domain-containing protein [Saccharomonospora sp. CUA-673]OLT47588.1 VWA domain-containing protein [Saccharomonospora sp. CUA-673]
MLTGLHRFAALLRSAGLRISTVEVVDAARCVADPVMIRDRELFREGLRCAVVKDHRDNATFDELFDAFFAYVRFGDESGDGRNDPGTVSLLEDFTIAEEAGQRPPRADMESPDADLGDLFDEDDLVERYSPHPELNPIVLDNETDDELVFSQQDVSSMDGSNEVLLEIDRSHGVAPGELGKAQGTPVEATLSLAEQDALLNWLEGGGSGEDDEGDETDAVALRSGMGEQALARLPEALRRHLEHLMRLEQSVAEDSRSDRGSDRGHDELEDALRTIVASLRGAVTHRKRPAWRGRVDPARTMRRNLRYDGVPFRPVTVDQRDDKPRLVVLADVSLSVRATAGFTLQMLYGLHDLFSSVRSYAFVAEIAEISGLFAEQRIDQALETLFRGDVIDVDANSDYGSVFGAFLDEHGTAVNRRTTVLVLGDGRGNGNDPNLGAFEEIARKARDVLWLTPEPRHSWGLGACDLPDYAEHCSRVRVVRDVSGLENAARDLPVAVR